MLSFVFISCTSFPMIIFFYSFFFLWGKSSASNKIFTLAKLEFVKQKLQILLRKKLFNPLDDLFFLQYIWRLQNVNQVLLKNIFHNWFVVVWIDFAITLRAPDWGIAAFKTFDVSKDAELAKCMPTVNNGMCESIQAATDDASKDVGKFLWAHGFLT